MREKFRFRSCVLSGRVSFRIRAHLSSDIRFVCEWFLCAIELFNSNCFESCNAHMFTAPLLHKQFEYSLRESTPLLAARLLLFIAFAIKNRIRKVEVCEIGGARANTKLSPARAAKNEHFAQTNNNWNGTHTHRSGGLDVYVGRRRARSWTWAPVVSRYGVLGVTTSLLDVCYAKNGGRRNPIFRHRHRIRESHSYQMHIWFLFIFSTMFMAENRRIFSNRG